MKIIQCKNELFNKLGSLFEYNYKDGKREVSSLKFLKILDNTDHLTKNSRVKLVEYFGNSIIVAVLVLLVYVIYYYILSQLGIIFLSLYLILLTFLVLHAYNSLILFFSYIKNLRIKLLILMIVAAFIIGNLTIYMFQANNNLFMEYDLNKEFDGAVWWF